MQSTDFSPLLSMLLARLFLVNAMLSSRVFTYWALNIRVQLEGAFFARATSLLRRPALGRGGRVCRYLAGDVASSSRAPAATSASPASKEQVPVDSAGE